MSRVPQTWRRIQSFVRRDGRMTEGQIAALQTEWPHFGLELSHGLIDLTNIFNRAAPCILEIGFGGGASLLATAAQHPEHNYLGIETHKPGIGALLMGIKERGLKNIRVYYADAVEVLTQCIPAASLAGVQLFFPDPWPKRRHHKRRLIQPEFIALLARVLQPGGVLHLATDWQDYAVHMLRVLSQSADFSNLYGAGQYAPRSEQRPLITKFEQRGQQAGRAIWELQFQRN